MQVLKKSHDFQRVLKKGRWVAGDFLNLYVQKNYSTQNFVGIAVGKKVSKSSVRRNRIKRLIREAYRLNEATLSNGVNIVIIWKTSRSYELANFNNINRDIQKCFEKAEIIAKG